MTEISMDFIVGTYTGSGFENGCDVTYTLTMLEKKGCWMDYRSIPPQSSAPEEQWHSDGRYTIEGEGENQVLKYEIGGLPGQGRAGQVYKFDVVSMQGPPREWSFRRDNIVLKSGVRARGNTDDGEGVSCAKCHERILGPAIRTKTGEAFHEECMACDKCGVSLVGCTFQLSEGRRLCTACSKVRCQNCGKEITGKKTKVMDSYYHPECFKCSACDKVLAGSFFPKDGNVFCTKACLASGKVAAPPPSVEAAPEAAGADVAPAAPVEPAKPSRPAPSPVAEGQYIGKGTKAGAEVSYTARLMKSGVAWLDYTSTSKISTSTWHAEGSYTVQWRDPDPSSSSTARDVKLVIEACPHGGGPKKGDVWVMQVDDAAGSLLCDGLVCKIPQDLPEEVALAEQPLEPQKRPQAAPAPAAAPAVAAAAAPPAAAYPATAVKSEDAGSSTSKAAPMAPVAAAQPAKPEAGGGGGAAGGDFLSLDDLKKSSEVWKERGIDASKREEWLSDEDFTKAFGMAKAAFQALPKWKRDQQKKSLDLF